MFSEIGFAEVGEEVFGYVSKRRRLKNRVAMLIIFLGESFVKRTQILYGYSLEWVLGHVRGV